MKYICTFAAILFVISSCDLYQQDSYREYYVVESYLVANDSLPQVRLSTTSPIDERYTFDEQALSGAAIEIRLLESDSTIAETYSYSEQEPGIYLPDTSALVEDSRLYQLHAVTAGGDSISSTTFVPGDFRSVNQVEDRYVYQSEQQIEVITTPSSYITNRQTFYIFTINVIEPDSSRLTPFYRDLVINEDNEIGNYFINSSGIINEGNYSRNEDGNITLRVPWLAIAFYGSNDVVANAIDDNMYDFLRSQDVQTGGTNLSPGEIQNIEYNVKGGIGIFGSMASDTNRVFIERSENQQ